jgi:hypothetical protein
MHDDRVVGDREVVEHAVGYRQVERVPWSPVQLLALVAGLILAVMGGVALARTGLVFHHLSATRTQVAGLGHTSLSGLIELTVSVLLIGAGAVPGGARGLVVWVGVLLLGAGMVIATQPSSFQRTLGYQESNGLLFVAIGGVLLVGSMASPVLWSSHRRVTGRHTDVDS